MQPNYYLLRNNKESGPYTIDELLLQGLSPADLVWVEGRTRAWCHPSELDELTVSYSINREKLKEVSPPPGKQRIPKRPKKIGKDEIESRAEEIRKNVLSQSAISYARRIEIQEEISPTQFRLPEERIELVMHKKKMKLPGAHATAIGIMSLIIAVAWYGKGVWVNESRFLDAVAKPFESSTIITIPEKKETAYPQDFKWQPVHQINDSSLTQTLVSEDSFAAKSVDPVPSSIDVAKSPVIEKERLDKTTDTPVIKKTEAARLLNEEPGEKNIKTSEEKKEMPQKEVAQKNAEEKKEVEKKEAPIVKSGQDKTNTELKKDSLADQPEKKRGLFGKIFGKKKKD